MPCLIRFVLLAAASVPLFGQPGPTLSLSGIVTDSSGAPVAEAAIRLEKGSLTATSGQDGKFTLMGSTALRGGAVSRDPFAAIRGGSLYLSLAEESEAAVTVYGIEGTILSTVVRRQGAGGSAFDLSDLGTGVRFLRVRAGMDEAVVKAFSSEGVLHSAVPNPGDPVQAFPGRRAAKRSAAVAYYDVITATKTGYLKGYLSISVSESGNLAIKLLKEGSPKFSFFVTSLKSLRALSGSQNGFGGDLRYGETGPGAGLRGADKICAATAERSMPASGNKGWRAFLSVPSDANGKQANAVDRIGDGPWHDRIGRLVAPKKSDLLASRPMNGDPTIQNDLPNEDGVPNHRPDPTKPAEDNHHFLTGSDGTGKLYGANSTCLGWTSTAKESGRPRIGFSYPVSGRMHWLSGQDEGGCGAGVNLLETGGSDPNNPIVGSGGGYGGFYCLAFNP
ncbi:MAG: carboxypeptidase-like regulatory domain-containing protein [Fibrobacteria bacterium]